MSRPRLADILKVVDPSFPPATAIIADVIAEQLDADDSQERSWPAASYGVVAPPWSTFFVEARTVAGGQVVDRGLLVQDMSRDPRILENLHLHGLAQPAGTRWVLGLHGFMRVASDLVLFPGMAFLHLDDAGHGGLPLALRVSAGILLNDEALPVERYLTQLVDERRRLAHLRDPDDPERDVAATLGLSYAALDQPTQITFRRLGVLAADADLRLIAGVLEQTEEQAEALLRLLLRRNLVEYDPARERWGLHDLVRLFALERLMEAGKEQTARLCYAEQVIQIIQAANQRYHRGSDGVREGLGQFDRERAHLEAVRVWLWAQPPAPITDALLITEAHATQHIGYFRDPVRSVQIPHHERAIAAAQRQGDQRAQGRFLGNLGNAYCDLGEARTAINSYEQWLALARAVGDRQGEGRALGGLGNAYRDLGEARTAIGPYEQWLALARAVGDRQGEGAALGNLGCAYADLGETRTAIRYYEQDLTIAREVGDRQGEGAALGNLGCAYSDLGEMRTAIRYYKQALTIAREVGDRRGEGMALGNLGTIYRNLGEARTAIGSYEQRLTITREVGDRQGEGNALGNLGCAYADLGETRTAIRYFEQHLVIAREVGDRRGEGRALGNLGLAYTALGEPCRAIRYQEQHLAIARETQDQRFEGRALANRGAAHIPLEDTLTALTDSAKALHLARAVGDQQLAGRVLCDLGTVYDLLSQHLEADAHYHQSLTLLEQLDLQTDTARTRWAYGQFLIRQGERERGLALMQGCLAYEQQIGHAQATEHAALIAHLQAGGLPPFPAPYAAFAPLRHAIVAVAQGHTHLRQEAEAALAQWERRFYHLTTPVRAIWAGQRDPDALTAGLSTTDAALIRQALTDLGVDCWGATLAPGVTSAVAAA